MRQAQRWFEIYSHTSVGKELTVHLIKEDVTVVMHSDLHVVCLEYRNSFLYVLPGLRNIDVKVCEDVLTNEHHIKVLRLGQAVGVKLSVAAAEVFFIVSVSTCALDLKNHHCRLVKVAGGIIKLFLTYHLIKRSKRSTNCVVYNVSLTDTDVNVRSHSRKNRGKERSACNELEVNSYVVVGGEIVVDKSADNLRLITTVCKPYLNRLVLVDLLHSTHSVIVSEEALEEAAYFVNK